MNWKGYDRYRKWRGKGLRKQLELFGGKKTVIDTLTMNAIRRIREDRLRKVH